MKRILAIAILLIPAIALAQGWESSPNNWDNSHLNYENNSLNFKNSPLNHDNSPLKLGNDRIVYDENGKATGYAVPKESGGVNVYDLDGDRVGYTPADDDTE